MKKILFSFFLTMYLSLPMLGQINLIQTLPKCNYGLYKIYLNDLTEKFFALRGHDKSGYIDTITIYNSDFTLRKQFLLPLSYFIMNWSYTSKAKGISDKLVNSDSLIEFFIYKRTNYISTISIINENGSILYTFPDTNIYMETASLLKDGANYLFSYSTDNEQCKVFSLPGTLPCIPSCSGLTGLVEPNTGSMNELTVYPNPFNNTLQVNYDFPIHQDNLRLVLTDILGREVKEIKLTNQSDNVSINTSDLPKGTIIVSLYGGQDMISKKVIKIE